MGSIVKGLSALLWKQWSLRLKLIASFACLNLIFLCVGVYNHSTINSIKEAASKQAVEAGKELQGIKLKQEMQDLSLFMSGFMISKDLSLKPEFEQKLKSMKEGTDLLASGAESSEERKWKASLDMTLVEYAGVYEQAEAIIHDKTLSPADVNSGMERLYKASQLHKEFVFETIDNFINKFTADSNAAQGESETMLNSTATVSMISPVIVLLLAVALAYVLVRSFTRPIRELQTAVNRIASGDLRYTVQSGRKDELGQLSQSFDRMVVQVRDMLIHTRTVASSLFDHAGQFTRVSNETAEANSNITRAFEEISLGADQQARESETSTRIISELEQEIQDIWEVAQSMRQTSGVAEQTTVQGTESVMALSAAAADTEQRVESVVQAMHMFTASSAQIRKIVDTITEISSQTNVLSLNAAIEAARAGVYGKGFSVIAEEVRVLSLQTNESSRSIASIINGLLDQTKDLESQLAGAHGMLLNQNTKVDETLTAFSAIRHAMHDVAGQISSVHSKVDEVRSKNNELIHSVQQVSAVAEETAAGVQEVNSTAMEQDASIRHIAEQAEDINRLSRQLFQQIDQFKTGI